MGKLVTASTVLVPLAVYLMCFRESSFDHGVVMDQRVLITGASSGIGEQLAYQYARLGARLVITARRKELLRNVSRTCEDLGAREVHFVAADMAEAEDRSEVIAHVKEHLGGLDHLILNHAILIEKWWTGSPENVTTLERVLLVNFLSFVDVASKALPMLTASQGRIGIVSSGFGKIGTLRSNVYSSAKFALHGFFSSLRQELRLKGTGVSVTIMVLGPVSTDTLLGINEDKIPTTFFATPHGAARAIMESVVQRKYDVRYDWTMQVLLLINDLFPQFSEDHLASLLLYENVTWPGRLLQFGMWCFS